MTSKHTQGPVEATAWESHIFVGGGPNNDDVAEFNFADEHTVKITREEAIANATLFAEAVNVSTETGMAPRQLVADRDAFRATAERYLGLLATATTQRDELLAALKEYLRADKALRALPAVAGATKAWSDAESQYLAAKTDARAAIAKVEGKS